MLVVFFSYCGPGMTADLQFIIICLSVWSDLIHDIYFIFPTNIYMHSANNANGLWKDSMQEKKPLFKQKSHKKGWNSSQFKIQSIFQLRVNSFSRFYVCCCIFLNSSIAFFLLQTTEIKKHTKMPSIQLNSYFVCVCVCMYSKEEEIYVANILASLSAFF